MKSQTVVLLLSLCASAWAYDVTLTVTNQVLHDIPSTLYGVILETNINGGTDGGLYAELIFNRAFQDARGTINGYQTYGGANAIYDPSAPLNGALSGALQLSPNGNGNSGVFNTGYKGIAVRAADTYTATIWAKSNGQARVTVSLRSTDGSRVYATAEIQGISSNYAKFQVQLQPSSDAPDTNNAFYVEVERGQQPLWLGFVSLFPPTYKDRPNGCRRDLSQAIADMKPGFVRLPGGNSVEGGDFASRYQWDKTLGPVENRPGRQGAWWGNVFWDTEGLGLLELAQWTEDLGAEIILGVYAAYNLNHVPLPQNQVAPFVDSVVNEIEFLIGDKSTQYGAMRAQLGHPKPFKLTYVEVGNEDFFDESNSYNNYRWAAFRDGIQARFPQIKTIATTRSAPGYNYIDDHDYNTPSFFTEAFRRWDGAPRPGPQIFEGEYAVIRHNPNQNGGQTLDFPTMQGALSEAVFMIGGERNADIVFGMCYAPNLQNVGYSSWSPNMISFDAGRVVKSTSYWAQLLFSTHRGRKSVRSYATYGANDPVPANGQEGDGKLGDFYFSASTAKDGHVILKIANTRWEVANLHLRGVGTKASMKYITNPAGGDILTGNTMDRPDWLVPNSVSHVDPNNIQVPAQSAVVITIKK